MVVDFCTQDFTIEVPRMAASRCCVAPFAGQHPAAANRSSLAFYVCDWAAKHTAQGSPPLLRLCGLSRSLFRKTEAWVTPPDTKGSTCIAGKVVGGRRTVGDLHRPTGYASHQKAVAARAVKVTSCGSQGSEPLLLPTTAEQTYEDWDWDATRCALVAIPPPLSKPRRAALRCCVAHVGRPCPYACSLCPRWEFKYFPTP